MSWNHFFKLLYFNWGFSFVSAHFLLCVLLHQFSLSRKAWEAAIKSIQRWSFSLLFPFIIAGLLWSTRRRLRPSISHFLYYLNFPRLWFLISILVFFFRSRKFLWDFVRHLCFFLFSVAVIVKSGDLVDRRNEFDWSSGILKNIEFVGFILILIAYMICRYWFDSWISLVHASEWLIRFSCVCVMWLWMTHLIRVYYCDSNLYIIQSLICLVWKWGLSCRVMSETSNEDNRSGQSSEEDNLNGQISHSEALAEWRSSDQVENGFPSTWPPYWDIDDGMVSSSWMLFSDDIMCVAWRFIPFFFYIGSKHSELYGKHTWKIEKYSEISKPELRSDVFDAGGYKWYVTFALLPYI